MKIEIPYKFKQKVFLINDPEQQEHLIKRFILEKKGILVLEVISPMGDIFEVYEDFVTTEIDILKKVGDKKEDDDED